MTSNNAKLREAVVKSLGVIDHLQIRYSLPKFASDEVAELKSILESALAEPPCQCEVGTTEEQAKRFEEFCSLHHLPRGKGCYACPALPTRSPYAFHRDTCRANWAQLPYESEAAK